MRKHEGQILLLLFAVLTSIVLLGENPRFMGGVLIWRDLSDFEVGHITAVKWVFCGWAILSMALMLAWAKTLPQLLKESAAFLGLSAIALFLAMLAANPVYAGKWQVVRLIFPLGILLMLAKAFHLTFVKPTESKWRIKLRPVATAVLGLMSIFLVLEGVFMFVARSNQNDNALASKIWFARHWEVNSSGFREAELPETNDSSQRKMLLIGDSFLAGHGVKDPANRFSDRLQTMLGANWQVHNHGENGASTQETNMQFYHCKFDPDVVVLCWYVNDIEEEARSEGLISANSELTPPWDISLLHGSYLVDYFTSQWAGNAAGENYLAFLKTAYSDPEIMQDYHYALDFLGQIAEGDLILSRKPTRLAIVLFPMMHMIAESEFALKPMRDYWKAQNIPCLDLSPVFQPYTPKELMVNSSDSHPNEFAHELASKAIFEFLKVNQVVSD